MRTSEMELIHPACEALKNDLKDMLERRMQYFLDEIKDPSTTPENAVKDIETWLLGLLDVAFYQDNRNTLTIGPGEEDEISLPCFTN